MLILEACKYFSFAWLGQVGVKSKVCKLVLISKAHDLCPEVAKFIEVCRASEVRQFGSLEITW